MTFEALIDEQMVAYHEGDYADHGSAHDSLTRFSKSVRKACAAICDDRAWGVGGAAKNCADAIREAA